LFIGDVLQADFVVHGLLKFLFAADVPLSCLDAHVPQKELDLFEFATGHMTQPRARAAQMPHAAFPALCRVPDYAECAQVSGEYEVSDRY
jgi:hypothetical protein